MKILAGTACSVQSLDRSCQHQIEAFKTFKLLIEKHHNVREKLSAMGLPAKEGSKTISRGG